MYFNATDTEDRLLTQADVHYRYGTTVGAPNTMVYCPYNDTILARVIFADQSRACSLIIRPPFRRKRIKTTKLTPTNFATINSKGGCLESTLKELVQRRRNKAICIFPSVFMGTNNEINVAPIQENTPLSW